MSDRKIRILILVLCIGGSVLAGISSRYDYSGPLRYPLTFLKELAGKASRALRKPLGATESTMPQPASATGRVPIASSGPDSAEHGPKDVDGEPSVETSRPQYRTKTLEESRVEQLIETTFRKYFSTYRIAGKSLTLRMPFGLNDERQGGPGYSQVFYLGGKGTPEQLWPYIDSVLASQEFADYVNAIISPGNKVILFELERQAYSLSRDQDLFESLRRGSYLGTPTRILVYRNTTELSEADVYNYLYAVASVGVDCSGFTFHIHDSIAQAYGMDISKMLGEKWRISPGQVGGRVGLWFYDPASGYTETLDDRIENLRPADIILFRGSDGGLKHSAIIQSIDLEKGLLRYVQCTDWAVEPERGVHQSVILFDPSRPLVSVGHYSVIWKQQVRPPFGGELEPKDWLTDRDRYMWYPEAGGSLIVRLQYLAAIFQKREPLFYSNPDGEQK